MTNLTYKDAGVDIAAGDALVEDIKTISARTHRPEMLNGIGGFGALFAIPLERYRQPVLVSGTDGVGTKLKLAHRVKNHSTIGIDLVAMCVNDILTQGAEPLFFLDYFATGQLELAIARQVIAGIGQGCEQAGAALIGGETAEMPGMYSGQDYDLAGFCVGIVEKDHIIDGSQVAVGDALIGIASSGPHSNGYSLIRKILEITQIDVNTPFNGSTLGEILLAPTRIYVRAILALLKQVHVKALAHITGGGLLENIPRVLPTHCTAVLQRDSWQIPEIFQWLQRHGNVADQEMFRTFNCGVGMVVCVAAAEVEQTLTSLRASGEIAWPIGSIEKRQGDQHQVIWK